MTSSAEKQVQDVVSLGSDAKVLYSGQNCPPNALGSIICMSYPRIQFWSVDSICLTDQAGRLVNG